MVEPYNTGTCTIRVGHDYVCLNFGSNSAASVSVQDRGTRSEVPSGRACSVTVPNTNCRVHLLAAFIRRNGAIHYRSTLGSRHGGGCVRFKAPPMWPPP